MANKNPSKTTRFTSESQKGNQNAKKDFTREMAKDMVSKELYQLAKLLCDIPAKKLKSYMSDNGVELSVIGTKLVEKAVKGDMKAIVWFVEMMVGKPRQQIEQELSNANLQIIIDKHDAGL